MTGLGSDQAIVRLFGPSVSKGGQKTGRIGSPTEYPARLGQTKNDDDAQGVSIYDTFSGVTILLSFCQAKSLKGGGIIEHTGCTRIKKWQVS